MSAWKDIWYTLTRGSDGTRHPFGLSVRRRADRYRFTRNGRRLPGSTGPIALIAFAVAFLGLCLYVHHLGKQREDIQRSPEYARALDTWNAQMEQHHGRFAAAAQDDASLEVLRLLAAVPNTAEDKGFADNLSQRILHARQSRDSELRRAARDEEERKARSRNLESGRTANATAANATAANAASPAGINPWERRPAARSPARPLLPVQPGMGLDEFKAHFGDCFALGASLPRQEGASFDLWDFRAGDDCRRRHPDGEGKRAIFSSDRLVLFGTASEIDRRLSFRDADGNEFSLAEVVRLNAKKSPRANADSRDAAPRRPAVDAYGNKIPDAARDTARPTPRRVDAYGNVIADAP